MGEQWFGVLRDHTGTVQITWTRQEAEGANQLDMYQQLTQLPLESCIAIQASRHPRPTEMIQLQQMNGDIEMRIIQLTIHNRCTATLPFTLESSTDVLNEELRLRHRYIDLRRPWMQTILRLRSTIARSIRETLLADGFVEVETPILFKSTPEGADEFIVPTRHHGRFYALPQSPQQHKQMLMVGGVDKYFQIARCFRDEGSRADRQPEFTQIDMEMAFIQPSDMMAQIERMLESILTNNWANQINRFPPPQFPLKRVAYNDALRDYGLDKPDQRYGMKLHNLTPLIRATLSSSSAASSISCPIFSSVLSSPFGSIHAIAVPSLSELSRKELDAFQQQIGKNVLIVKHKDGALKTPGAFQQLFAHEPFKIELLKQIPLQAGDALLVTSSPNSSLALDTLGKVRIMAAHKLVDKKKLAISAQQLEMFWVVDFPLFKFTLPHDLTQPGTVVSLESLQLASMHHPFTAPVEEDLPKLIQLYEQLEDARHRLGLESIRMVPLNIEQIDTLRSIRGQNYDVVCNGIELGGGSIRLHDAQQQTMILSMIGAPLHVFDHILLALRFGAPPHGGIALGLDRIVALLGAGFQELGSPSSSSPYGLSLPIREVIAFPKTSSGQDLLVAAPSQVNQETLKQYHIQTIESGDKKHE